MNKNQRCVEDFYGVLEQARSDGVHPQEEGGEGQDQDAPGPGNRNNMGWNSVDPNSGGLTWKRLNPGGSGTVTHRYPLECGQGDCEEIELNVSVTDPDPNLHENYMFISVSDPHMLMRIRIQN